MRGVAFLTAVTFVAEIGDVRRFETPRQLMAYLGLVPSERSTGEQVRRGSITKAGNPRARRVLIEGAWTQTRVPSIRTRVPIGAIRSTRFARADRRACSTPHSVVDDIVENLKTGFDSQLLCRNCQTFSTGLSSGHFGGSAIMVIFGGTTIPLTGASRPDRLKVLRVRRARRRRRFPPGAGSSPRCRRSQDQGCTLTPFRATAAKSRWKRRAGRGAHLGACRASPSGGDLVLLANTSPIREPDFYRVDADRLLTRDCVQARGEAFLKSRSRPRLARNGAAVRRACDSPWRAAPG